MKIIGFLIIGALAGWAAGELVVGSGFGLVGNIVVGVVGAVVGGMVLQLAGVKTKDEKMGTCASFITAVIGAVIVLVLVNIL